MPCKLREPRGHHIDKTTFRITKWPACDEGLRNRGSLTFWVEETGLQSWCAAPRTTPGGQAAYAAGTIEMILTLGMVYHLPLRQTEGLARSVSSLMDLPLRVPRHGTLSRRRWRKLSIGVDPKDGEILSHKLTDSDVGDPIHETVRRCQPGNDSTIIIPPRRTATLPDNADGPGERGRMAWQKTTDHGRRSWVETVFGRYKSIIGDSLGARDGDARVTEVAIGIKVLNRIIGAARAISARA